MVFRRLLLRLLLLLLLLRVLKLRVPPAASASQHQAPESDVLRLPLLQCSCKAPPQRPDTHQAEDLTLRGMSRPWRLEGLSRRCSRVMIVIVLTTTIASFHLLLLLLLWWWWWQQQLRGQLQVLLRQMLLDDA
jgi:hypothetical protein